jgi:adenine-specific DNA-methyltransferase
MTCVFIGGSRDVSRLDAAVKGRLLRIVEKRLPVVIGDANGADKAVQRYFSEQHFDQVEVFSADPSPRNNLGGWPIRVVSPPHARRDFVYYAAKDRAMAAEATVGLMLWNGESRGTLLNVLRLVAGGKPVVVYLSPKRSFIDVRSEKDLGALAAGMDNGMRDRLRRDIADEGLPHSMGEQLARGLRETSVAAG